VTKQERIELRDLVLNALNEQRCKNEDYDPASDHWASPLWHAIRTVKGVLDYQGLDGMESWELIRSLVPLDAILDASATLHGCCPETEDDAAAEWASAWDKIRYLPGETILDAALRQADLDPVVPPRYRGDGYARFLAVCKVLASGQGGKIAIPEEKWAALLRVRVMTISQWRKWAVNDGILTVSCPHSRANKRATEFQADLAKVPHPSQVPIERRNPESRLTAKQDCQE
jgi:hypothetical protein